MVSENEEIEYINTFYKHLAVYIIMQMHTSISKAVITSSAKGHFEIYFEGAKNLCLYVFVLSLSD